MSDAPNRPGHAADDTAAPVAAGPTRWLDADERAAWLAIATLIVRLPAALDAQLQRDAGLSMFEYMVLAFLSEQPTRTMQMSEIAAAAASSLSRLSHTAKRLETAGYLTRQQLPGGGRRTNATLTDAGYAKVVESAPGHVTAVRRYVIDTMSRPQLAELRHIGQRITEAIDSGCSPGAPPTVGPARV